MLLTANIFQPLISVFAAVIKFFHDDVGLSWGWSIVLLTVCVRLVLVPLAIKQIHSMRRMQHVQPQMKAIQQKYKQDKQRQQEEMMKFYKENDINPLASCLPLVAQLPVFISLFYMLRKNLRGDICQSIQTKFQAAYAQTDIATHHVSAAAAHLASLGQTTACGPVKGAGFLFIKDITNQAHGVTLVVLMVLYVGTQLLSTLAMPMAPTMDKSQRNLMLIMPVAFVIFIIRFPAGLIVYWVTTNTWTMLQQFTIKRLMGPAPPPAVVAATDIAGPSPRNGGRGGDGRSPAKRPSGGGGSNGGASAPAGTSTEGALGRVLRGIGGGSRSADVEPEPAAGRSGGKRPPPPRTKRKRSGRRR
jgi:YidC/Oxa1 family membrane protein insertase